MAIPEEQNMQCLMDHIVVNVEDEEKMIAFYTSVLEFTPERLEDFRAGDAQFPSVRLNSELILDLFPKKMWQKSSRTGQGRDNLNHFCIALNKGAWENLLERLHANHVEIEEGLILRWGALGNGT